MRFAAAARSKALTFPGFLRARFVASALTDAVGSWEMESMCDEVEMIEEVVVEWMLVVLVGLVDSGRESALLAEACFSCLSVGGVGVLEGCGSGSRCSIGEGGNASRSSALRVCGGVGAFVELLCSVGQRSNTCSFYATTQYLKQRGDLGLGTPRSRRWLRCSPAQMRCCSPS